MREWYTFDMRSKLPICALLVLALSGCATSPQPSPKTATGSEVPRLEYEDVLALAEIGNADAQFELGAMYHDGDGAEQDYAQALEWYEKAAKAGNRQAQFNLGLMYKNGEGMAPDLTLARRWFTRSADAGDMRAMFQLGAMTYTGLGVEKKLEKALEYFWKSAMGDLAESQLNVGVMYIRGESVIQDLVEGYAWLSLAAKNGHARAEELLASLEEQITPEQKEAGKKRAAELRVEINKLKK